MMEKSAAPWTSLGMDLFSIFETADDAGCAVHFHRIAIAEEAHQTGDGDDGRNAQLARNDGRVGQERAALDEQAGGGGKEHDPAGVGALGDENSPARQSGAARVADDADLGADAARTAGD